MTIQSKLRFAAFVLCFTCLFVGGLFFAHTTFITSWNEKQLRQLATDTLARTELALDSATMKMSDVIVNRSTSCDTVDRMAMTKALYGSSIMKNMRLETQRGVCWSYDEKNQAARTIDCDRAPQPHQQPRLFAFLPSFPGLEGIGRALAVW